MTTKQITLAAARELLRYATSRTAYLRGLAGLRANGVALTMTNEQMWELHQTRAQIRRQDTRTCKRLAGDLRGRLGLRILPLGEESRKRALEASKAVNRRIKCWDYPEATTEDRPIGAYDDEDLGKYSNRCTFHQIRHTPVLTSYARAYLLCGVILARVGRSYTMRLNVPRGYTCGEDSNGVYLRANSDGLEYHPTSDDALGGTKQIVSRLKGKRFQIHAAEREHREAMRAEKAKARWSKLADDLGVHVCLQDSVRGGNCAAGTLAFARRHRLDARRHVPAAVLLRIADPESRGYVTRAVDAARRQTALELERGYTLLADHAC